MYTVRPISCEGGFLHRTHGSSLFTRGETQAIAAATLGSQSDAQRFDGIAEMDDRRFYLHYFFPPSSVGECGRVGAASRREVGHGNLAERALAPVLPSKDEFPFTVRLESTITESNGSSSMATVCAGCLALQDAGVPIRRCDFVVGFFFVFVSFCRRPLPSLRAMVLRALSDTRTSVAYGKSLSHNLARINPVSRADRGTLRGIRVETAVLRSAASVHSNRMFFFCRFLQSSRPRRSRPKNSPSKRATTLTTNQYRKVAGIAMGLVLGDETKGEDAIVLTDILGSEDALGDMDFKVAGDGEGMSAFQMDIKVEGISLPVMRTALERAREGLIHILGEMDKADPSPRKGGEMSKYAPRIEVVEVNTKYIGKIIGKGGEQIKSICEETRIDTIDINNDGVCVLTGSYGCDMVRALEIIAELTIEPEIGKIYRNSRVTKVLEFGAFVEILPGVEGLCHVSELDVTRVANVKDVVNDGDFIDVKLLETNERGQYKLSRREVLLDDGKGGGGGGGGSTLREDPASRFLSENGQISSGLWDSDRGGGGGRSRSSSKARRGRTRLRE